MSAAVHVDSDEFKDQAGGGTLKDRKKRPKQGGRKGKKHPSSRSLLISLIRRGGGRESSRKEKEPFRKGREKLQGTKRKDEKIQNVRGTN